MNKKLSPYDIETVKMIESVTGSNVEYFFGKSITLKWKDAAIDEDSVFDSNRRLGAVLDAVKGKLGDRFQKAGFNDGFHYVQFAYDPISYPDEYRFSLVKPNPLAGEKYCRILKEVSAVRMTADNLETLISFVGGGILQTGSDPIDRITGDFRPMFIFPDQNGVNLSAYDGDFVIMEENGDLRVMDGKTFKHDFEPK